MKLLFADPLTGHSRRHNAHLFYSVCNRQDDMPALQLLFSSISRLGEREQAGHHQAHLSLSDTCRERMQICKVLTVQGAWVIFKPKCIPEKATVVREVAKRKDVYSLKKKNNPPQPWRAQVKIHLCKECNTNGLLHRTFIQFHIAF